jgi:flavin-dependent dehydrogenase
VGGGPAGSTAAAVLAAKGCRVLVLEKDKFPRYHVGESLLPFCYFPLERIGMIEKMKASEFPKKYSVQFVSTEGKVSAPFYFFQHMDHEASTTWQVLRSQFDSMLLDNARQKGARVMEETEALGFRRENGRVCGVRAAAKDGTRLEVKSRIAIDASGRRALAISRNDWRKWDPELNKVAVWTYFRSAKRDPGLDEGSTTIAYLPEKSWFWYIPLPDDTVSVGIVAERNYLFGDSNDLGEIFCREIGKNAWIKDHLAPGRQFGKYYATKEFSYRSEYCAEDGLVLVGDAFAFLDPVFSSGVYLALRSGELAADAIDQALEQNDVSADQFQAYSERLRREIEAMRKLVYAFYDQTFSFGRLIKNHADVRGDLTDCLIGNLDKDLTELFTAVAKMASVPEPLPHGEPLVTAT